MEVHGPYSGIPWFIWVALLGFASLVVGLIFQAGKVNTNINFIGIGTLILLFLLLLGGLIVASWVHSAITGQ